MLIERYKKIALLQQRLMFEGTKDNSFLKLLTLKKGIKLLSRSLPMFDKVHVCFCHFPQGFVSTRRESASAQVVKTTFDVSFLAFQNQSSTLLLLVVQHVALLTKKDIQQELVKGLELPIVQCLKACDLESLVVLSQTLMVPSDNKADVAASTLQIEVCWAQLKLINSQEKPKILKKKSQIIRFGVSEGAHMSHTAIVEQHQTRPISLRDLPTCHSHNYHMTYE